MWIWMVYMDGYGVYGYGIWYILIWYIGGGVTLELTLASSWISQNQVVCRCCSSVGASSKASAPHRCWSDLWVPSPKNQKKSVRRIVLQVPNDRRLTFLVEKDSPYATHSSTMFLFHRNIFGKHCITLSPYWKYRRRKTLLFRSLT